MSDIGYIQNNKISRLDYFVATFFFASGGNGLITGKWHAFIFVGIMVVLLSIYHKRLYNKVLLSWLFSFLILSILQISLLRYISMPAYFNFAMKLIAGFMMVNFLGTKFRFAYLNVCTFFSAISLVFWIVHMFHPFHGGIPVGNSFSFGFWSYFGRSSEEAMRNQGMFWEPGAFQGYLMMVPILFIDKLRDLWSSERRKCLILFATLLSTFSTTGYITFMLIIGLYLIKGMKNPSTRIFLIIGFLGLSYWAFNTFDFLGEKINSQYEKSSELDYSDYGAMQGRMGTMYIDMEMIAKSPLIGNGFDAESKYGAISDIMATSGNGLTGLVTTFGIPFFIMYVIGIYKSHPAQDKYFKFAAIVAIFVVFYGESFYNFIPYWALLFAHYRRDDMYIFSTKHEKCKILR